MRIAICCLYVTFQIIYLLLGDSSVWWGCFNILTHILFVAYLCSILEDTKSFTEDERLLFCYLKYISIVYSVYTLFCCFKEESFAIYNTSLSAYILGIGFVSFIIHRASK